MPTSPSPTSPTSQRAFGALALLLAGYLAVPILAAAPGSPLSVPLPRDASTPAWASRAASALGLDRTSHGALTVAALMLVAVLLGAFVAILLEARAGRVRTGAVLAVTAVALTASAFGPLILSRDIHSYAAYGRIVAVHGANPYRVAPSAFPSDPFTPVVSDEWRGTRSVYGPVFTLLSVAIGGALAGSPNATILAFKLVAGIAMMGTVLVVSAMCRSTAGRTGTPAFAAAAIGLNPALVLHAVGGGHNDALVALGIAAAAFVAVAIGRRAGGEHARPRPGAAYLATALLSVTAFLKIVASIPLLLWIWRAVRSEGPGRRVGAAVRHGGVALAIGALATAPLFAGASTLGAIANLASRQGWASPSRLVGRGMEEVGRAIGGDGFGDVLRTTTFVVFLAPFAVFVVQRLRRSGPAARANPAWEWGVALLLFAMGSPYLLPWYAAWFLVLLPAAGDERLLWIGLAASGVLALTGIPAEPVPDASAWHAMLLVVHYVAAPIMLALYALTVRYVFAAASARE